MENDNVCEDTSDIFQSECHGIMGATNNAQGCHKNVKFSYIGFSVLIYVAYCRQSHFFLLKSIEKKNSFQI